MTNRPAKIASINLHNALSWKFETLNLSPGLNVVVGPSDSGKTNVYRAVRAVVENAPADRFVRIGESEGFASIEFDDGATVTLAKGTGRNAANSYRVDGPSGGRLYQKVGADCPAEVSSVLRLGPVDLSGFEADIHFASQRGPAFGVDVKPGDLARIIGSVCGLDAVYSALSEAERSRKSAALEDARADAAFKLHRAKYRAAEGKLNAEQVKEMVDRLASLEARQTEIVQSSLFLEETAGELEAFSKGFGRRVAAFEAAALHHSEAEALRSTAVRETERIARLASMKNELVEGCERIEDAELSILSLNTKLADLEAKAHQLTKVKCPLCGRSGR